jgi:16S rRNA (guanine966-N2)-methyltransferase
LPGRRDAPRAERRPPRPVSHRGAAGIRIVAGEWRGRRLLVPAAGVRPTRDMVRQVLFDILGERARAGPVLDLYAGSGALGLEALSRGAPSGVFVESSRRALAVLEENLEALGARSRARVLGLPARSALTRLAEEGAKFAVVLADPPYNDAVNGALPAWLREAGAMVLVRGGVLVLEVPAGTPEAPGGELPRTRVRRLGETELWFHERPAMDGAKEGAE